MFNLENNLNREYFTIFMRDVSIGQADGSNVIGQKSNVWNISDGFMKIKVLRLLIELDLHESIALFGRKDMEEQVPGEMIAEKRVEALYRMLFTLQQLIGNCKFTIEKKDKWVVNNLVERMEFVEKVIDGVSQNIINDVTKEEFLSINEPHFRMCFNALKDIKDELNVPINKAGLIFRKDESVDLDTLMRDIMEGN